MSQSAAAAGAALLAGGCATHPVFRARTGEMPQDAESWALLSDTHIAASPHACRGSANMADQLRRATADIIAGNCRPAGVIVSGDCAYQRGHSDDYKTFHHLLTRPVLAAGIPLHLTLGNHDHREHFRQSLQDALPSAAVCGGRCAAMIPGRHANWFLLDSLEETDEEHGSLGDNQLNWLAAALRAAPDKPALIVCHHPLHDEKTAFTLDGGLTDGDRLWELLCCHSNVKAFIYGHTHRWNIEQRNGINLVNLPSMSYVFEPGQPRGWVEMRVGPDSAQFCVRPSATVDGLPAYSEMPSVHWS